MEQGASGTHRDFCRNHYGIGFPIEIILLALLDKSLDNDLVLEIILLDHVFYLFESLFLPPDGPPGKHQLVFASWILFDEAPEAIQSIAKSLPSHHITEIEEIFLLPGIISLLLWNRDGDNRYFLRIHSVIAREYLFCQVRMHDNLMGKKRKGLINVMEKKLQHERTDKRRVLMEKLHKSIVDLLLVDRRMDRSHNSIAR